MKLKNIKEKAHVLWLEMLSFFNVKNDLVSQQSIEETIRSSVSFKGSMLLTLIFAIFIASLGLNTNSIPVIIGAMLISPLMGPIIGIGLGIAIEDIVLVKRGLKNISEAVLGSILASAFYFMISPQYEGASQLLARTSPSIYDVFVALFGGAAGILSIASKDKGQVMPGVAIATSLMPPLCTAGYGLATLQWHFFFGALYLFLTNMIFIFFATWIGVKLMGFKNFQYQNEKRAQKMRIVAFSIVTATILISVYLTINMIKTNVFLDKADKFVKREMVFPNTQVLSHTQKVENGKRIIDVTLIGDPLAKDSLQIAMLKKLDSVGLGGTILNIKQGFSSARNDMKTIDNSDQFYRLMQAEIEARQNTIDSLRRTLRSNAEMWEESVHVAPEVKVLFPEIKDIAMTTMVAARTDTAVADTINMIFVNAPRGFAAANRQKLINYIQVRTKKKEIHLTVNPTDFPWPTDNEKKNNGAN